MEISRQLKSYRTKKGIPLDAPVVPGGHAAKRVVMSKNGAPFKLYKHPETGEELTGNEWAERLGITRASFSTRINVMGNVAKAYLTAGEMKKQRYNKPLTKEEVEGPADWQGLSNRTPPESEWKI